MATGGGEPTRLAKERDDVFAAAWPSWSPDGKTIAFMHAWEGGAICFVKPDGTGARIDIGPGWGPITWLADSSAAVYEAAANEVESSGIAICSPTGDPKPLLAEDFASSICGPTATCWWLSPRAAGRRTSGG